MLNRFPILAAISLFVFSVGAGLPAGHVSADEPDAEERQASAETIAPETTASEKSVSEETVSEEAATETKPPRVRRIANYLSGAKFTGQFTVDGKPNAKPESYTISSCEPLEDADMYRLKVKIQYGDVDGEFPMDLKILWAGSTPVITLDAIWIPGLGTFSSRVLIHQNRYAGTWQHDDKGGQLFGKIEKVKSK